MSPVGTVVVEADGGSRGNPGPAGYGAVVRGAAGLLAEANGFLGRATNNVAEYSGLIAGLEAALALGATDVEVRMDSKLVVEQMSGRWQVKHPDMKPLARRAAALVGQLGSVRFRWVPRAENGAADRLANLAMDARASTTSTAAAASGAPAGSPANAPAAQLSPRRLSGWMSAPAEPTTLLLLRHGQTPMSVDKRFSGSSDPDLTAYGQRQASAAAAALAAFVRPDDPPVRLVSSPRRRARQTAAAVAAALDVDHVDIEPGVAETDFGAWEGLTFAEVSQRFPDALQAWLADPAVAPPRGESFLATQERVAEARDRLTAGAPGRRVIVVSHVSPIKILTQLALEAPSSALYRLHLDTAALTEIDVYADGPQVLRRFNDTGHLATLTASMAAAPGE